MFDKILCAVDGSEHAYKAAQLASELAATHKGELTFLTVTKAVKMNETVRHYIEVEHLAGEPQYVLDQYTESVMQRSRDAARDNGVANAKTEVKTGNPARVIVQLAERGGFDTIVLGSRGLGDLEGFLLGSVAHKVASLAKCTVITVK